MFHQIFRGDLRPNLTTSDADRLLSVWEKCIASSTVVSLREFGPDRLLFAADFMIVLKRESNSGYFYEYFGDGVASVFGANMQGQTTRILTSGLSSLLESAYDDVMSSGQPMLLVHRANDGAHVALWERLIFPVVNASSEPRVLVYARPRETDQDLLAALLDASPEGVAAFQAIRDESGAIVDALLTRFNKRAIELSGVPGDQMTNQRLLSLFPGIVDAGIWRRYLVVMSNRTPDRFDVNLPKDGIERWIRIAAVPFGDGFMISYNDITEFKQLLDEANKTRKDLALEIEARQILEGELRRMATMDGLTGILNRRGYEEILGRSARQALLNGQTLSIISFDLDHFKLVNDQYGHAVGDIVLMSVVSTVADQLRKDTDSFARVGGEEFILLLPDTPIAEAAVTAERIRLAIESAPIFIDETMLYVTASFGVHSLSNSGNIERMMIEVDKALYKAKQDGRNRVQLFLDI